MPVSRFWTNGMKMKGFVILFMLLVVLAAGCAPAPPSEAPVSAPTPSLTPAAAPTPEQGPASQPAPTPAPSPAPSLTPAPGPTPEQGPASQPAPSPSPAPGQASAPDEEQPGFIVLDKTLLFAGERADPSVIQLRNKEYLMYLNRFGEDGVGTFILKSQDSLSWEEVSDIVFRGIATGRAFVFEEGVRFYYPRPERFGTRESGEINPRNIVSSFSIDGITSWQYEGILVEPSPGYTLTGPTVVKLWDGGYRMFFAEVDMKSWGGVLIATIYGASSQDGLSWVRDQEPTVVYETQVEGAGKEYDFPQVLHPFVMRWPDGGYLMFYNSHQRIFAAYSRDAVTWEKLGYTGIGGADSDAILLADGSLRIYYGGWCQGEAECVDAGPGVVHTSLLKVILPPAEATVESKAQATADTPEKVDLGSVWQGGFLFKPTGDGPFPAVIYNHGGSGGDQIGGAPEETSRALANNGYVGFSPLRKPDTFLREKLDYIAEAVNYLKTLDYVDANRIGIMGFSQGGFLTFLSAADLSDYKAVVIMASAVEILDGYLDKAGGISAPVLLLIAENDYARQNHVQAMTELNNALKSAGKDVELIVYPPYKDDGHQMFFEIGDYWEDVIKFLNENL